MNAAGTSRAFSVAAVLVALTVLAPGGHAQTSAAAIAVRSASHADFGRLVIDTSNKFSFTLDQDGDHLVVRLSGEVTLAPAPALPRNVVSMKIDGAVLDLVLRHGTKVRSWRLEGRVVLDVMDDASLTRPATPAAETPPPVTPKADPRLRPRPPLSMASSPELGGRSRMAEAAPAQIQAVPLPMLSLPAPLAVPLPSAVMEATQQLPPGRDVLPENATPGGLRARRTRLPKEMDGTAFLVPFSAATGAAAFLSGDSAYVVFDERRAVDLGALKDDPVFGAVSARLLPNGTVVRVPLRAGVSIALTPLQQGWRMAALTLLPKPEPIVASEVDGRMNLAADQPGDVVAMADPDTGATLLVGTLHRAGQGVMFNRRTTEFILHPTLQGVVVEPLSDAIALKQIPTGFSLSGNKTGLALSPPSSTTDALMDAAHLTRQFSFSGMPKDALLRLSIKQIEDAAATPTLARGPKHHAAAETLLAMGLSAEAESLLRMAAEQDPKEAASPDTKALTAVAALLAGRPEEAGGLMDPRLNGTDEIALWRAVRQAMQDESSPQAAAVFAATAPLVFQYPATIRDRILPLMVETMIQGGEIGPAARLLRQQPDDPRLGYARALLQLAEGNGDKALAAFEAVASGHDQFDRARAAIRAVELRLAMGRFDKTQAADALDKLLYAWRGDSRELALRQRVAELRSQTGAWREALTILRQAEADFPEQAGPVHERLKDAFAGMVRDHGAQQMPPIDFVATVEENTDLMPNSGEDEVVGQSLLDRLIVLDLPARAKPLLAKLMKQAKSPSAKARFGGSLAMLAARDGDDAGAVAILDASQGADLPPELTEQRLILRAKSVANQGDTAGAAAMLAPARTVTAMELRAQILETAQDWPKAEQAWSDVAAATVSNSGMLDEPQTRTVLRLATAIARAGEAARLTALREMYGPRIGAGPLGDMFRLLTAEPISTPADIVRSQREMSLAASVPAGLKALAPGPVAR
jgi:tetratricopeptide (TPR) repeat protein